jgi:hypothetical protein
MKTLKDVAGTFKELALTYMVRGPWKPAYKTGNLYNRVSSYNTANRMIKESGSTITITLDFAPDGAEYGKFVHNGTVYMVKRPFAQLAAEDSSIKAAIKDITKTKVSDTIEMYKNTLSAKFTKLAKK